MPPGRKRVVPKLSATDAEWAYLAGLIDGEGCIGTHRQTSTGRRRVSFSMKQKYPAALIWVVDIFGGRIHEVKMGQSQPGFLWRITSGHAEAILRGTLPYLTLKKPQAEVALKLFYIYDVEESIRLAEILSKMKRTDMTKENIACQTH